MKEWFPGKRQSKARRRKFIASANGYRRKKKKISPEEEQEEALVADDLLDITQLKSDMSELLKTPALGKAVECLELDNIGGAIHFFRKHLERFDYNFTIAKSSDLYRDLIVRLLLLQGGKENTIDVLNIFSALAKHERTKRDIEILKYVKQQLANNSFVNRSAIFNDLNVHTVSPIDRVANRVGKDERKIK